MADYQTTAYTLGAHFGFRVWGLEFGFWVFWYGEWGLGFWYGVWGFWYGVWGVAPAPELLLPCETFVHTLQVQKLPV